MDMDTYSAWWDDHTDAGGELLPNLPEPVATLAAHVQALQERIDELPDPTVLDSLEWCGRDVGAYLAQHGWVSQCGCAYDHPEARCLGHRGQA